MRGSHCSNNSAGQDSTRAEMDKETAISVCAAEITGTILSSTGTAINDVADDIPRLVIHVIQPQNPQSLKSTLHTLPGDHDIQLHPVVEPGLQLLQIEHIPAQADTVPKVSAIRQEVRTVF
jgi:hypothetical protein